MGGEFVACLGWQEKQKKPQDRKVIRPRQGQYGGNTGKEGDPSAGLNGWGFLGQTQSKSVLDFKAEMNFSHLPSRRHERLPTNMLRKAGANFFALRDHGWSWGT